MKKRVLVLIALIGLVAAGGIAAASMDGDNVTYTGCLTRSGNIIKVAIGEEPAWPCAHEETVINWNAQGPQGPPGPSGVSEAFATGAGDTILTPSDSWVDVMALDLPAGNFVSNVTLQASYFPWGLYEPKPHAHLECKYYDANTSSDLPSATFGGTVSGQEVHAQTCPFTLDKDTERL